MYSNSHKTTVRLLYKTILRLHRGLPEELRLLGTIYVRDEFRRHKNCDEPTAAVFITQWAEYASLLTKQISVKGLVHSSKLGRPIDESILDMMREEQIAQLYELMKAATSKE
ncbi:succinate dehydrogenase assembly factor 3, mitochondrial [Halyomorpha halys]|uniref:succinate dehydrogenase assembly factor 3, mitochondrial n=1 Tax=Halyomorpha halys TaxID=286706 RepID=UPI0006D4F5F6|nr:succinate dehydrogenase assembly factor 3, mitochondrial [Halyomorpha halys]